MSRNDYVEWDQNWGQYVVQGKRERDQSNSLWQNQNTTKPPTSEHCWLGITRENCDWTEVKGHDDLSVRFFIEGGSDAPRFRLRLKIQSKVGGELVDPPELVMDAIFLPWWYKGTDKSRPTVSYISRDTPQTASFTFSTRLRNVEWSERNYGATRSEAVKSLLGSISSGAAITWDYENPICMCFQQNLGPLRAQYGATVDTFKNLAIGTRVKILTKASKSLIESYNFFVAQPCPTPPHFYRWAVRQNRNERTVDVFPELKLGSNPTSTALVRVGHQGLPAAHLPSSSLAALVQLRHQGWPAHPPSYKTPTETIKFVAPIRYLDERHYEVFKTGDLERELQYEERTRPQATFNAKYPFDFRPILTPDVKSDRSYLIRIPVRSSAKNLHLPPPEVGTQVTLNVTLSRGQQVTQFQGRIIPSPASTDEYEVSMIVTRKVGGTGFILDEHEGNFFFGSRGTPSRQIRRSIIQSMHGGAGVTTANNWMRPLLLAHDPRPRLSQERLANRPDLEPFLEGTTCTAEQRDVIRRVFTMGTRLEDRFIICQGPPGTGKTHTILTCLRYCLQCQYVFLVTASSNIAVNESALRLLDHLLQNHENTDGIYRMMPDVVESMFYEPEIDPHTGERVFDDADIEAEALGLRADANNIRPEADAAVMIGLYGYLESQMAGSQMDAFSLVKKIRDRLRARDQHPPDWKPRTPFEAAEEEILYTLILAKHRVELWTPQRTAGTDEQYLNPLKYFNSVWLNVQKFYLRRARGIFVNAATAGVQPLRVVPVSIVVVDEASQIKEIEVLNATVRHMANSRLRKIAQFGDQAQLGPHCQSHKQSEFEDSTTMSLFDRLIESGFPCYMLTTQRRMHPDIVDLVNNNFYEGRLRTSQVAVNRPNAGIFRDWARYYRYPYHRQAIWVTVQDPVQLLVETGAHSKLNPTYIHAVTSIIQNMLKFSIPADDILLITFYAAQKRCYKRWFKSVGVNIPVEQVTVEGAQGREAPFVVLDCVTPGGPQLGLGFLADMRRTNVALSRAEDGLIIVGSSRMASVPYPSKPVKKWQDVIKRIQEGGGEVRRSYGSDDHVRQFLKIPGPAYEPFSVSGG